MCIALLAKKKISLVDGTCSCDDLSATLQPLWDLSANIVFASSATLVWKDLQEWFNKVDGS